jgi:hypothetical protein
MFCDYGGGVIMFEKLIDYIFSLHGVKFQDATQKISEYVNGMADDEFIGIVREIGIIPECIEYSSTEEKLYSKSSDIVLARCFKMLGLNSKALGERGNSADVLAESISGYNYSLVADAKCFRLSRTAKNQKDFKISNLSDWRGSENEYAVLVAPYFQYPKKESQIYSKALMDNVCLLSWEHIYIMLKYNVKEDTSFTLESIWDASKMIYRNDSKSLGDAKNSLMPKMDAYIAKKIGIDTNEMNIEINKCKEEILKRGKLGTQYWNDYIDKINQYDRETAIIELIKIGKLNEKRNAIEKYVKSLIK